MFRIRFFLWLLITLMINSSCSQLQPNPQPLPSPSTKWTVKLNQSGGIAGVLLLVEVSSDGQLKAEDNISHRSVEQTLSVNTTAELRQIITRTSISTDKLLPSGCADCFIYDLEIRSEESLINVQVDDVTIKDSGAAELIAYLRNLRDDSLKSSS